MLRLFEISTTAEEIRNGVVAMGETLLSCYLYGEIMARQHWPALMMMSYTSFTHGYLKFREIETSHKIISIAPRF
jgi:hypothetical protein